MLYIVQCATRKIDTVVGRTTKPARFAEYPSRRPLVIYHWVRNNQIAKIEYTFTSHQSSITVGVLK
jgi:hypothetical protein